MKNTTNAVTLLLAMGLTMIVVLAFSGCKKDQASSSPAAEHPAVEKAAEHPDAPPAEVDPATAKPKDHPAH